MTIGNKTMATTVDSFRIFTKKKGNIKCHPSCGVQIVHNACKHRGAALHMGTVEQDGALSCPYHGWRYGCGRVARPWDGPVDSCLFDFQTKEQDGLLWLSLHGTLTSPPPVPYASDDSFRTCWFVTEIAQCAQLILENGIDPSHASWVHANGLGFGTANEQPTNVRHGNNTIAFDYVPNRYAVSSSLLGITTTKNTHAYALPYTTWSEVILRDEKRLMTYVTLCPVDEKRTRMFVCFAQNFGVPSKLFVAMGKQIVEQDRRILENQDQSFAHKGTPGVHDGLVNEYRAALRASQFF